jgi:hypothetical protein
MSNFGNALALVKEFRRPYVAINLAYYGLMLAVMFGTCAFRPIQKQLTQQVGAEVKQGILSPVGTLYTEKHFVAAVAVTFLVNLLVGGLLTITLPSLVVPFTGFLFGLFRAALWGVIFSPTATGITGARVIMGALIAVLLALEGQGYVLAILAGYIHNRLFLSPGSFEVASHWKGYKSGAVKAAKLYIMVAIVLLVAAMYEAVLGIYLAPWLR